MDKAKILELQKRFKQISVVPNEKDFADSMASLIQNQIVTVIPKNHPTYPLLHFYTQELWSAEMMFNDKLSTVFKEFPAFNQILPSFSYLLCGRYDGYHYFLAQGQVYHARELIRTIAYGFEQLLDNGDCDSLEKFKRLEVNALGCMYTVAMRCMPSLAYLEKVRQYIASLPDSCLEFENNAAASTLRKTKCDAILADEDCTFPLAVDVDVHNVADFVHPDVFSWLDELVRENGPRIRDDQLDFAKQSRNPKEHLATVSSMKSLVI
ncbi:hypothetical protein ISN44_As08g007810 [Arabidopsis suecica]|uniref:NOG1 N-terminal helical domain-containing protein n=1 Tax=Arabidopsis suecica TaxID=45249 RepID=A0A8T2B570_ARASU|nr:hypothetical protein ISN44_As08g007810 [Arabidopsis suecica]